MKRRRRRTALERLHQGINPIGPPTDAEAAKVGAIAVSAGAVIGASLGAATVKSCDDPQASKLCGPGWGAARGALWGTAVTGLGGLATAAFSRSWRRAGMATAGLSFGAFLLIGITSGVARTMVGK
jgi:hypothetical protein